MGFNVDKFTGAKFVPRTKDVPVPGLAQWFGEGEAAVWKVRGLTGNELNRAMEAQQRRHSVDGIVKAIAASGDQADAIRAAIGLTKDAPGEVVKRLEMLVTGSVEPAIELPTAVRLAEAFPVEFLQLTNEITMLTGMGHEVQGDAAMGKALPASPPTQDS